MCDVLGDSQPCSEAFGPELRMNQGVRWMLLQVLGKYVIPGLQVKQGYFPTETKSVGDTPPPVWCLGGTSWRLGHKVNICSPD